MEKVWGEKQNIYKVKYLPGTPCTCPPVWHELQRRGWLVFGKGNLVVQGPKR